MNAESAAIAGLIAGLFGSAHCMGMCGGIAGLVHAQIPAQKRWLAVGFHGGRIGSYLIIALIATLIGLLPTQTLPEEAPIIMRVMLGAVIVMVAVFIALPGQFKDHLGQWIAPLTQRLMPLFQRLMPVYSLDRAVALGMLWGCLPCGLLYTMVASAVLLADPVATTSMMVAFGLGTTPALLGTGMLALHFRSIANRSNLRWLAAGLMLSMGLLIIFGPVLLHWVDHPWVHFLADCVAPRQ